MSIVIITDYIMNIIKISSLFVFFLNIPLFAQSLDSDFINSLPESIKKDIQNQISTNQTSLPQKNYTGFKTQIFKQHKDDGLKKFGSTFFQGFPSTFMPINDPSADPNYILDVDDLVRVNLIGSRNDQMDLRIDRSGNIFIKDLGLINLAGISLNDAKKLINSKIQKLFIGTEAIVSIKEIRDIEVLITGFVNAPGIYVLGGYSSVIHAINTAGGVSDSGSFRSIVIKRNGEIIKEIDLYDIFVYGDTSKNISLRSGDSIVVPVSNNFVPVIGGVNQQAIYEFKPGESVEEIINFAGGFSNDANLEAEYILTRESKNNIKTLRGDINSSKKYIFQARDKVFVPYKKYKTDDMYLSQDEDFISKPVTVSGAVRFPGEYILKQNQTLLELLREVGGFREDAYIRGAALFNSNAKSLEEAFNERLYNEAIKSLSTMGSVTKKIDLNFVPSLLTQFKETEANGRIVTEFSIETLENNPDLDYRLSPGDKIHIPYYKDVVYIFGEVLNPGTLVYSPRDNINNYIDKSGGLNKFADNSSIIIVHPNGESERVRIKKFAGNYGKIYPGSVIYVPRDLTSVEGLEFGAVIAPIVSSLAISLASLNSITD